MRFNLPENSGVADVATSAPSRRTLLRTAATVTWAAPAVTVVSAAPAFATSNGVAIDALQALRTNGNFIDVRFGVSFTGGALPIGSTITVFLLARHYNSPLTTVPLAPSGWTAPRTWVPAPNGQITATYAVTSATPASPFTIRLNLGSGGQSNIRDIAGITVSVQPTGRDASIHVLTFAA